MNEFNAEYWKVRLPDGWLGEQEAECDSIYNPDGPGVLQISALIQDQPITPADLQEFAREHVESGARLNTLEAGDFTGISVDYDVDDVYWREWYLKSGNLFLFMTYHCALTEEGKEDDTIDSILESLQHLKH